MIARQLSADLATQGFSVVSGLARGIDTAAHEGALEAGGHTLAVLGCGINRIYPAQNRELYGIIADRGALISEFPLDAEPDAHHFPIRNRIISGISLGTLVVEASRKSGSLITARLAADQGREVFAVPGSIRSFKSTGTHALIKQGAALVQSAADIVAELGPRLRRPPAPDAAVEAYSPGPVPADLDPTAAGLLNLLGPYPLHVDELVRRSGLTPAVVLSALLTLELAGLAVQHSGKRFTRC
jgi:DNA processing protein